MTDPAYRDAVKSTFEDKPLRSVLMIDDQFPTYADLAEGIALGEQDRALVLYKSFRERGMLCDIENDVGDVRVDRIRKSDLIILDYELDPASGNEKSIELLRELAGSKHFNTVVVYTANPEQDDVWLDIFASLRGGWVAHENLSDAAQAEWDRLSAAGKLPPTDLDVIVAFAKHGSAKNVPQAQRKPAQDELIAEDVPQALASQLLEGLAHRELARRAGKHASEPQADVTGARDEGIRWIQTRNCFIAVLQKQDLTNDAHDPAGIMGYLGQALLRWRPNLFHILVSEIQNILELEALATEDDHLRDAETQVGLWYYLLNAIGPFEGDNPPDLRPALRNIIDKIVDGIRRRLASDPQLLALATQTMLSELKSMNWNNESWPKNGTMASFNAAHDLTRPSQKANTAEVLFRLNSFFSTEKFRRAHITTGTVFRERAPCDGHWIVTSPACDLVARMPTQGQDWSRSIHPLTAFIAIKISPEADWRSALATANQARHVFLETSAGRQSFRIENSDKQPSFEIFIGLDEGRVRQEGDVETFRALRIGKAAPAQTKEGAETPDPEAAAALADVRGTLTEQTFEIVDQLRAINATRILQTTGQHLSRIGLDFISLPKPN